MMDRDHLLAALAVLFVWTLPARAALYTTTATGSNWSQGSHWTPAPPAGGPGNGDTVQVSNDTTIDAAAGSGANGVVTIGTSPLNAYTGINTYGTGGAANTTLGTGTYKGYITVVDTNAVECPISAEFSFALTTATKAQLTLSSLPVGGSSYKLYLTAAGGATASETLYCSAITHTTLDLTSGSWMNTDTAGVAAGGASALDGIACTPGTAAAPASFTNCTFTSCGRLNIGSINATAVVVLQTCTWTTTLGSNCVFMGASNAKTGGTRLVDGCYFDKTFQHNPTKNFNFTNNVFACDQATVVGAWDLYQTNLNVSTVANGTVI